MTNRNSKFMAEGLLGQTETSKMPCFKSVPNIPSFEPFMANVNETLSISDISSGPVSHITFKGLQPIKKCYCFFLDSVRRQKPDSTWVERQREGRGKLGGEHNSPTFSTVDKRMLLSSVQLDTGGLNVKVKVILVVNV